jgi:hypothetical protein
MEAKRAYNKRLYDLEMHEIGYVETDSKDDLFTTAMRVPGGWIYRSYHQPVRA